MKPAAFEYHRPDDTDGALALLAEHGYDAKLLAGGQSLVPAMNFRLAQPAVLIDLNRIRLLDYVAQVNGGLVWPGSGSATSLAQHRLFGSSSGRDLLVVASAK